MVNLTQINEVNKEENTILYNISAEISNYLLDKNNIDKSIILSASELNESSAVIYKLKEIENMINKYYESNKVNDNTSLQLLIKIVCMLNAIDNSNINDLLFFIRDIMVNVLKQNELNKYAKYIMTNFYNKKEEDEEK